MSQSPRWESTAHQPPFRELRWESGLLPSHPGCFQLMVRAAQEDYGKSSSTPLPFVLLQGTRSPSPLHRTGGYDSDGTRVCCLAIDFDIGSRDQLPKRTSVLWLAPACNSAFWLQVLLSSCQTITSHLHHLTTAFLRLLHRLLLDFSSSPPLLQALAIT